MGVWEVIGLIFKVVAEILDLHAKGSLTKEKVDSVVNLLHQVQ